MALGKIDHIDFYVDDLGKAEQCFTKKLGFKLFRCTEHLIDDNSFLFVKPTKNLL